MSGDQRTRVDLGWAGRAFETVLRGAWLGALAVPLATSACGSDPKPSCEDHLIDLSQACGTYYAPAAICATPAGRCRVACSARASCEEREAAGSGMVPWLAQCWTSCLDEIECPDGSRIAASWRCDGEEDCVGGVDEHGCSYFECAQGSMIDADRQCDRYLDCPDGSDETDCAP